MKIFFIADTHFYHKNIIDYCGRPYTSVEEMNKQLVKNWNATVHKDDLVIHLGDVGLGSKTQVRNIVKQLHGRKILIKGNHDIWTDEFYKTCGFERVSKFPIIWGEKYILSHAPLQLDFGDYINIFGHVHNNGSKCEKPGRSKCVSVEMVKYTPIELGDLNDIILKDKKEIIGKSNEKND
jgi:calcineurin-like phosphoesterase family protein